MEAMVDRGAIANYFKLLKEVLDDHTLLENPAQTYNVDELGGYTLRSSSTSCCGEKGPVKNKLLATKTKSQSLGA